MNDTTQTENNSDNELNVLKARADLMGIKYHHKIGVEKLRELVNGSLKTEGMSKEEIDTSAPLSRDEFLKLKRNRDRSNAGRLVRCRVTCMNPMKKEWEGEIFSVGSSKLGTFKKYVPYNVEWHIPHIMYEMLKEKKCSVYHTVKDHLGQKIRKSKLVSEFSIEVLPPLTQAQLKDLGQKQAMANGTAE